jgi:hypothetical protein
LTVLVKSQHDVRGALADDKRRSDRSRSTSSHLRRDFSRLLDLRPTLARPSRAKRRHTEAPSLAETAQTELDDLISAPAAAGIALGYA